VEGVGQVEPADIVEAAALSGVLAANFAVVVPVVKMAAENPWVAQRVAFPDPVPLSFCRKAKLNLRYQLRELARRLLKT